MKTRKILWGLGFLAAALLLIAGNLYSVRVLDILIMLVMLILLIVGLIHRNFILLMLSAAVILVLNGDRLGLPRISPWTALAAALFGGIGLNMLFPCRRKHISCRYMSRWKGCLNMLFPRRRKHYRESGNVCENGIGSNVAGGFQSTDHGKEAEEVVQTDSKQEVRLENNFGQTVKYLTGELPGQVHLENSFGSMTVYFDGATGNDHAACVHAETAFGNIILNIPASWNVIIKWNTAFGNIREKGHCDPNGAVTLEIRAEVSFGEIEIRYI